MKINKLLHLSLIIICGSCNSHNADYCESISENKNKCFEFHPDGSLKAEFITKDGKIHGLSKYYFENGILKNIENYHEDRLHGQSFYFYENGNIFNESTYKKGKRTGLHREFVYSDSGALKYEVDYKIVRGKEYVNSYVEYDTTNNSVKFKSPSLKIEENEDSLLFQVMNPAFNQSKLVIGGFDREYFITDSSELKVVESKNNVIKLDKKLIKDTLRGYIANYQVINQSENSNLEVISKDIYFEHL